MTPEKVVETVLAAIKSLSPRERETLLKWEAHEMTLEQIASDLSMSHEGVRKASNRAKQKVASKLREKLLAEKQQKPVTPKHTDARISPTVRDHRRIHSSFFP